MEQRDNRSSTGLVQHAERSCGFRRCLAVRIATALSSWAKRRIVLRLPPAFVEASPDPSLRGRAHRIFRPPSKLHS